MPTRSAAKKSRTPSASKQNARRTPATTARRQKPPPTPSTPGAPQPRPTTDSLWATVDRYLVDQLVPQDAALTQALQDSTAAELPGINVAPNQGKLLHLLARIHGAKRILEIGTLGGYSAIWLARALPANGSLVTLEIHPRHAEVARTNLARAGLSHLTEVRLGRGIDSLAQLATEGAAPFDLVFIDADKPSNPDYFAWALKLTRPGSVIIVDNVVRRGLVADPTSSDPNVIGVRKLNELIAAESRVTATSVQTVGSKGHDGFTLILVTA